MGLVENRLGQDKLVCFTKIHKDVYGEIRWVNIVSKIDRSVESYTSQYH